MAAAPEPVWAHIEELYALLQLPLTLLLLVAGPTLLPRAIRLAARIVHGTPPSSTASRRPAAPVPSWLIALVALHTVYHAFALFLAPPFNVFTTFGLPLDIPGHVLRAALETPLARAATARFAPHEEAATRTLVALLAGPLAAPPTAHTSQQALAHRLLYARFGHSALLAGWPRTLEEHGLVALARAAWAYLAAAGVGLVVAAARGGSGRKVVGWAVGGAVAVEAWVRVGMGVGGTGGEVLQVG